MDDLLNDNLALEMVTHRSGERRGQPDYGAWFKALLLPTLRKEAAISAVRAAYRLGDNESHLEAYRHAQPEMTAMIQRQIDAALKGDAAT